ncbi:hypothetical protein AB2M62_01415 [Sphingomonas sp. MMS12-HWE2-04]|uniref:hypothetical protein n=1 Tax=Sphingomonas sp. MMS12-HWE2-04 TaxID=3234199 RepID=UPI00384F7F9B
MTIAIPSLPPARFQLRRIAGGDEATLAPERPGEPSRLLAALVRDEAGAPVDIGAMLAAVHDRLLAQVYRAEIGDTASCRATCASCDQPFEFALDLAELIAAQDREAALAGTPDADGYWAVESVQMRAPTIADAATREPNSLFAALCISPPEPEHHASLSAFLERAAPLLALDLDATCPHCQAEQQLGFDLPRFLVRAIGNERPFLIRETHLIAARYGWSHAEIMALPRDDRRAYAALIESERGAALRQRATG